MIRAIVGLPGSGKTYFVVRRLYGERRRVPTRSVFSNVESLWFPFGLSCGYVDSLDQCFDLSDCSLFLDEAHLWFGSRDYAQHGAAYAAWVSQLRKRKVELWYTTQALGGVDKLLRDRTDITYHVRSWLRLGFFTFVTYDGCVDLSRKVSYVTRGFYIMNPLIASCYDTLGTVASSSTI